MLRASQMSHRQKPEVYDTVGRCIYCGDRDNPGSLTREHVIPEGLGGALLFRKASCKICERITGRFEEECLRNNFSVYRAEANLPSSRPPLENPRGLCLPLLPRPGILVGRPPSTDLLCDTMLVWSGFDPSEQPSEGSMTFNLTAFIRTLAKIGHGYAVAKLGIDSFVHTLPDVILWNRPELAQHLVGISDRVFIPVVGDDTRKSEIIDSKPMYAAHEIYIKILPREAEAFVIAGICLFAAHGAPFYECIAGTLTPASYARIGRPLPNQMHEQPLTGC